MSALDPVEFHAALDAEAVALANFIVTSILNHPDGAVPYDVIASIMPEMTRDLPDTLQEAAEELARRCVGPLVLVEIMARMVVCVIRGAERAGLTVNVDALSSPYDVLRDLEDPDT